MPRSFSADRRRFFQKAAVFGGSALLLGLAGKTEAAEEARPRPGRAPSRGYRVTEHVARYYERARS